jgi:hypothetical protein
MAGSRELLGLVVLLAGCAAHAEQSPPVIVAIAPSVPTAATLDVEGGTPEESVLAGVTQRSSVPAVRPASSSGPWSRAMPPALRAKVASGVPIDLVLEVRVGGATGPVLPVGSCKLTFDLWEDVYRYNGTKAQKAFVTVDSALANCVDEMAYQAARASAGASAPIERIVRPK